MVHLSNGIVAFVDNTDESEKFHYTWQTTDAYRRRFGFWNYEAPYGKSFSYQSSEGVVDTAGSGLQILSPEGEWLSIPKYLTLDGTAMLSALMWYSSSYPKPFWLDQFYQREWIQCIFPISLPLFSEKLAYRREWLEHLLTQLPDDMTKALKALLVLWTGQAYQREWAESYRAYHDWSDKISASERNKRSTNDAELVLSTQATDAWEMTASYQQERMLLAPLIAALDRERQRQIGRMVGAMNQFVELLHDSGNSEELPHGPRL